MGVAEQYRSLREEIASICRACGRRPQDVMLVAVSKTVSIPEVEPALEAGAKDFGENRPDEIIAKQAAYPQARWHFIGNVQSRRIADIVPRAHLIHSVYKADHLPKIDAAARTAGKVQDILLEINSGEAAKGGIAPNQAQEFLEQAAAFDCVRVCGLMTMAPQGDPEVARACFARLRSLRDTLDASGVLPAGQLQELSMGMSEDWHQAIEEGATIIRVGRAIFSREFA